MIARDIQKKDFVTDMQLEEFLKQVAEYQAPHKERTIFSLGGRGYYENATSDMLAFFLRPDAEHGFRTLFLIAFFECMGVSKSSIPDLAGVNIERERKTLLGNRIDLEIIGQNWCLIVENKICQTKNNPFEDYENHAKNLGKPTYLAILSPDGEDVLTTHNRWVGIKYSDYCARLRESLGMSSFNTPHSKWHLFAREFVLHIENEIYTTPMTHEQAHFVEQHATEMLQAKTLLGQYPEYICFATKIALENGLAYTVEVTDGWAVIIKSPEHWGKAWIALRLPTDNDRQGRSPDSLFDISIYPDGHDLKNGQVTPEQSELLRDMRYLPKHNCWITTKGFNELRLAVDFIIKRIKLVEKSPTA